MALRFRKSFKIAPGLRVNVTHRGASARIGPKGAGYSIHSDGSQHASAGIPGTGLSVSQKVSGKRKRSQAVMSDDAIGIPRKESSFPWGAVGAILVGLFIVAVIAGATG